MTNILTPCYIFDCYSLPSASSLKRVLLMDRSYCLNVFTHVTFSFKRNTVAASKLQPAHNKVLPSCNGESYLSEGLLVVKWCGVLLLDIPVISVIQSFRLFISEMIIHLCFRHSLMTQTNRSFKVSWTLYSYKNWRMKFLFPFVIWTCCTFYAMIKFSYVLFYCRGGYWTFCIMVRVSYSWIKLRPPESCCKTKNNRHRTVLKTYFV